MDKTPFLALAALAASLIGTGGCATLEPEWTMPERHYDSSFRTIRVPAFKNTIHGQPEAEGLEAALTRAIVREIEKKTPYKVVGQDDDANTELTGTIESFTRANPIYKMGSSDYRDYESTLKVELTWRDLRNDKNLLAPKDGTSPAPYVMESVGYYRPEIGESRANGRQRCIDRMAEQIIKLREIPQ